MKTLKQKITTDILRNKCDQVSTLEEAELIVKLLDDARIEKHGYNVISAPEMNIFKQVAIIRMPNLNVNLINPKITASSNKVISLNERCVSFGSVGVNCFRYNQITVETGMYMKNTLTLSGSEAIAVQHAIDHLNSTIHYDKAIKLGLARKDGEIKSLDLCPCLSRKRFHKCCGISQ